MTVDFMKSALSKPDKYISKRYPNSGYKDTRDKFLKGFEHEA